MERPYAMAGALIAVVFSSSARAESVDEMAAELARLRGEVESLSSDIEEEKEASRSRMRSLVARKASIESELQGEALRLQQVEQDLARIRARIAEAGEEQEELRPAIAAAIASLERAVRAGIPFRTEDRVKELKEIGGDVADGSLLPAVALTRLWTWVEDELRLTRENGLYEQTIEVRGVPVLARVARLGMVSLYFETPGGEIGAARKTDSGWSYRVFTDPADVERTNALFAALEQRVRVGFYELPNALPEVR